MAYEYIPAHESMRGGRRSTSLIKYLVYHYTANRGDTARGNAKYFSRPQARIASAHYFVDDKEVIQSVSEDQIAYAVGGGIQSGHHPLYGVVTNLNSISIEMCCQPDGSIGAETIRRAQALGREICGRYYIDRAHVIRHYDVNGKLCPDANGLLDDGTFRAFVSRIFDKEDDDVSAQEVWDYQVGYDGQPGEKNAEAWKRLGWINKNVDDIKTYLLQHSDPAKDGYDGDIYTRIAYMDQRIREISANNSALTEAVKTLVAAQGADPEMIAQMVADAVKTKLDSLQITMSTKTGQ